MSAENKKQFRHSDSASDSVSKMRARVFDCVVLSVRQLSLFACKCDRLWLPRRLHSLLRQFCHTLCPSRVHLATGLVLLRARIAQVVLPHALLLFSSLVVWLCLSDTFVSLSFLLLCYHLPIRVFFFVFCSSIS